MYDLIKIAKDEAKARKEHSFKMDPVESSSMIDLPYISLNAKQLPEIKKWEVGKEYEMTVKVKMNSYSENKSLSGSEIARASFDVIGIELKTND
jgi:hypothetical protein